MLTKEQLALRRTGIGSSDIAALAGVDKRRNAIAVYVDKKLPLADVEEEPEAPTGRNPRRWGHKLQRLIIDEWAAINGFDGQHIGIVEDDSIGTLRHPKIEIALASPDAAAVRLTDAFGPWERLCEAKAPGLREAADEWDDDGAPDGYVVQTQWQMGVAGVQRADLCALIGGQDFRIRPIEFDAELFGNLVDIAQRFWTDHVLADRPPPLDYTDASEEYLRRRFGLRPKASMLVLPEESPEWLSAKWLEEQIRTAKAAGDEAEKAEKTARNQLKEMVGDAEGIEGICTSRLVQRAGHVVEPTEYRELRLARLKKARK